MYLQRLKIIMAARRLKAADIAKLSNVSRACVCKWFKTKDGVCNIETRTLLNLAKNLKVSPEELLKNSNELSQLSTRFLWDSLFPNMETFVTALSQDNLIAMARLVQVLGIHDSIKVSGNHILKLFSRYKKYIKPVRQSELEILWKLYLSQN